MLTLTDRAVSVLKTVCTPATPALRIGVVTEGCSGLQYRMALETAPGSDDEVLDLAGLTVLIDPPSSMWLTGVTVDFVDGAEGGGFVFNNPNAQGKCACSSGSCG